MNKDEQMIQAAISEAKKCNSTPYFCVIAKGDKLISSACNNVKVSNNPIGHAEINAIQKACKKLKTRDLTGCTLYSTCEPCAMCFSAAWWAKISRIVFGLAISDIITEGKRQMDITCKSLNKSAGSKIEIRGNICKKECLKLFKALKNKR